METIFFLETMVSFTVAAGLCGQVDGCTLASWI
jgi:hypothetical protein